MLTLDEITEKMIMLENEIDCMKNRNFQRLLFWKIKSKELELKNLKKMRGELLSPDNFLEKFAMDKIRISVPMSFETKKSEFLVPACSKMRICMAERWGFLVPTIRIVNKAELNDNEFEVLLRNGESRIFKIKANIAPDDVCNYIVAEVQAYLFERAEAFLSVSDMFLYVRAAQQNEPESFKNHKFWNDNSDWFAYNLGYILVPLLSERYCVKNISYILDFIYSKILYERKSKDYVLEQLRKTLKKYPESLFVSDWALKVTD